MTTSRASDLAASLASVGERRRSRERGLALLYEAETKKISPAEVLAALVDAPEPYATSIVAGVAARHDEIDKLVSDHSRGWDLERMPALDRALLRLSTYELLAEPNVPTAVIIDEAVELAKQYSTEDSSRFVNGVLSAVSASVRSEEKGAP